MKNITLLSVILKKFHWWGSVFFIGLHKSKNLATSTHIIIIIIIKIIIIIIIIIIMEKYNITLLSVILKKFTDEGVFFIWLHKSKYLATSISIIIIMEKYKLDSQHTIMRFSTY